MALDTSLLTKETLVPWVNGIPSSELDSDLHNALVAKATAMSNEDKTDNIPEVLLGTFEVVRKWVDLAAANEWKSYVEQAAADYNVPVDPITISDI